MNFLNFLQALMKSFIILLVFDVSGTLEDLDRQFRTWWTPGRLSGTYDITHHMIHHFHTFHSIWSHHGHEVQDHRNPRGLHLRDWPRCGGVDDRSCCRAVSPHSRRQTRMSDVDSRRKWVKTEWCSNPWEADQFNLYLLLLLLKTPSLKVPKSSYGIRKHQGKDVILSSLLWSTDWRPSILKK